MTKTLQISPQILDHPWYRMWECGELSINSLGYYAQEYYTQVSHFPRYLSALHSQLDDLKSRQVILRNLQDEENEKSPHPELWLDFAESLGLNRDAIAQKRPDAAAQKLVDTFHKIVQSGPAQALGALLAYESQVPNVAHFKKTALEKHYLAPHQQELGTRFFRVHEEADVWHTQELDSLVENLTEDQKHLAQKAANEACQALWSFLDAMPTH